MDFCLLPSCLRDRNCTVYVLSSGQKKNVDSEQLRLKKKIHPNDINESIQMLKWRVEGVMISIETVIKEKCNNPFRV